ncbi:hypothetical protein X797_008439 [Metarhizium robertsii]|uniref:Uncharacterized protein n=2 Tax=Metarhizium robertsii TaxID=568076 RepID=E9F7U1_METRA|nr:uncharacterized protein MAA_08340 [Metarhizium robertsii ARSEF 23]EFY96229.1 hypothetical protein MAA_08340 [Metarhizium robertsii ARSEF 23]EXU98491.1 hypothetical protein X797_008439 [Metarhizium robertsii]
MASLRWTKWLVLLVHVLWASNIVAALPPATYVYHVSAKKPSGMVYGSGGIPRQQFKKTDKLSDYINVCLRDSCNRLFVPLGFQEVRQALRAWADPASSHDRMRNVPVGRPPILYAIRPGPSTVNGPEDGSFYQQEGWPIDQIPQYSRLPDIDGHPPSQQAIHDMSDEALDQYIGRLKWVSNSERCERAAAAATRRLLRNNNPEDQQRMIDIDEIMNAVEEARLCGSTDNPNPGPPPTGDQAAHPGPSTRGDCERKSAEIVKGLTPDPDPARWEEVAGQLVNVCDPSQSEEPVAGPSGLQQRCQEAVAKKLKPVIEKSKAQKRPVPEVVAQAQQAICSPSASDQAQESSSDEPPPKKSKDATERCNRDVSNVLGVFDDVGAAKEQEIINYLLGSDHAPSRDLCFSAGVYEFFSAFPWDILDDQGQDEAALPAEPEQQQPGQEPQQEQDQEEQLGVQQWPDFLNQVWQHFRVDERRLVAYLDRNDGLSSLQQEHAPIYSLLQQTFPSLLGVLRQIAEAGLTFGACLPGPPSSPKARATQGKKDELCAKVLAAIGKSAKAPGSQQKENDKTPSTSPSAPPSAPQDDTSPSVLKAIAAIGIPLAGAGLGAFAASAAGEGLLASTAASLGIGAAVGTAEGVEGAVSTVTYSMPRTVTQVVTRALTRVSRLGHRVSNPLLRRITSDAIRAATRRAPESIPLLP